MARETAAQRRAREAQEAEQGTALQQAQEAEREAEPDATAPAVTEQAMETATDGAPSGEYGDPAEAPVNDYPERPYAEALTPEHAETLRAAGQHPEG